MKDKYLESFLKSYSTAFDALADASIFLMGAAIFLIVRGFGILRDEDVAPVKRLGILVSALITGACAFFFVFLAEAQISSFYEGLFNQLEEKDCVLPKNKPDDTVLSGEAYYFETCYRPTLKTLMQSSVLGVFSSVLLLLIWATFHFWDSRRKHD